jgi:hypothetical protein
MHNLFVASYYLHQGAEIPYLVFVQIFASKMIKVVFFSIIFFIAGSHCLLTLSFVYRL